MISVRLRQFLASLTASEIRILGALAACAITGLLFLKLVNEVILEGEHGMDRAILYALRDRVDASRPLGPAWAGEVARDITSLGSTSVLTIVTIGTLIFLSLLKRSSSALFAASAIVSGTALVQALKVIFGRSRPDVVPAVAQMMSMSFPSGHATMSAIVYLTLAALLARELPRLSLKVYVLCMGMLLTGLVGISRVYLGFHWPSDVLAGWALGAGWALVWWGGAEWLERQRGRAS